MPITRCPAAVVFVHGLAKKPPPAQLEALWLGGLLRDDPMPSVFPKPNRGIDLAARGVTSLFNYYADVFYGADHESDLSSYHEVNESPELVCQEVDGEDPALPAPRPSNTAESAFLLGFRAKLTARLALLPSGPGAVEESVGGSATAQYEIASWLPLAAKQAILKKAAMEAFYYLFDKEYVRADGLSFKVKQVLRSRLLGCLAEAKARADKVVLVSHSMGTIIAYDVLRNCAEGTPVDTLITLGSPLGIREVQEQLIADGAEDVDFPAAKLGRWLNVYDPLDPLAGALANDYRSVGGKKIEDTRESNWGNWRHTITHYFAGPQFRRSLAHAVDTR